jgi:multiple sugar transport system permease protein
MKLKTKQAVVGWTFIIPFLIVVLCMLFIPLAYAYYLSSHQNTLVGGNKFVWFSNYKTVFTDPLFLEGLKRVALFGLIQIPLMLGIALLAALVLDTVNSKMAKVFRLVAFLPYAVPAVVGALMWGFLDSNTFGPFGKILLHLGFKSVDLFAPSAFIYTIGNIVTWAWTGYNMIVIYSALRGLPRDAYESALIDGASQVQIARYIKIPAIKNALILTFIFCVIGTMQIYTEPSILSRYTQAVSLGYTPNIYAYNLAFSQSQFNYSAAVSFALALVVFIASYGFFAFNRRRESQS